MSKRKRRCSFWTAIGAVVLLFVIAGLLWKLLNRQAPVGPDPAALDGNETEIPREAAMRLFELRNLSLGYLENEDLPACDPLLLEISNILPGDPFGPRNLSIARLLALLQIDANAEPQRYQSARRAALEAIEMLRSAEGDTPLLHVLRARIESSTAAGARRAFEELQQAASGAADEAWIHYELFRAGRISSEATARDRALVALTKAVELQPDNVWLLIEMLPLQAEHQDPEIDVNLQRLARIIAPFASTIVAQTRIDPVAYIEQARNAAANGDWQVVLQRTRVVSNVLRPDPLAQADKLRVDRHPLSFVLTDFAPAVLRRARLALPEETDAAIPVQFAATVPPAVVENVTDLELADFDLDGTPDLFVVSPGHVRVFRREEAGSWGGAAEADLIRRASNLLLADLDDDVDANRSAPINQSHETTCRHADVDAVVWGQEGLFVLENRLDETTSQRTLAIVEQDAEWQAITNVRAAVLVDVDHDGDLDVVALAESGISIWSNRGNLTFENINRRSALPLDASRFSAALPADWDQDLDFDLLLPGDGEFGFLENLRHGRLRYRRLESPGALSGIGAWEFADLDNDQHWELIGAGEAGLFALRTRVDQAGGIAVETGQTIDTQAVSEIVILDYDNDGVLDLIAAGGTSSAVYRGEPGGTLALQQELSTQLPSARAITPGDLDRDGDLDLLLADAGAVHLYENRGGNAHHWIDVAVRAQQIKGGHASASGRVNHLGIGSTLTLRSNGVAQTRLVRSGLTHFGIGDSENPDIIRVLWTNGVPQNVIRPPARSEICELQTLKGSCPYLYTWTGERFEFLTDLLWAAPLGLQFGEGIVAPWREWEYLKIPGDRLRAHNGVYRLQITEELWEAAYFDQIRLIAVDHPVGVEVFTNEKVGPAEIAAPMLHTVRRRQVPVAARDHRGLDVLPIVAAEDGVFLKGWNQRLRQGLTEPHSLELELGDLGAPQKIMLFLTGWVYPSDTSINVALSQNPDLGPPRPPFLETPDESGRWREALPYMGFPGGKTKTIAVDISDVFTNGNYRLRIGTTMEVYWDAVWFTVDEAPSEYRETDLKLLAADLHFRGISRREWGPGNAPETYFYDDVNTQVPWPPMGGAFTRYGDVAALLEKRDDQMVVMGAGDELTVEFAVPPDLLPEGWTRDFVIYNVGWDKDADLNTVYGQSTEPLPFYTMNVYGLRDGEVRPVDPDYFEYLQTYQRRYERARPFWRELRGLPTE